MALKLFFTTRKGGVAAAMTHTETTTNKEIKEMKALNITLAKENVTQKQKMVTVLTKLLAMTEVPDRQDGDREPRGPWHGNSCKKTVP